MITAIISTGATGAERGALEAAIDLDLQFGGWHPAGAEVPPVFADRLRAASQPNPGMARRLNIQDSDATLIISFDAKLRGVAEFAAKHAQQQRRNCKHLALPAGGQTRISDDLRAAIIAWLEEKRVTVLHVVGPGEDSEPGIGEATRDALVWLLEDELPSRVTVDVERGDVTIAPAELRNAWTEGRLKIESETLPLLQTDRDAFERKPPRDPDSDEITVTLRSYANLQVPAAVATVNLPYVEALLDGCDGDRAGLEAALGERYQVVTSWGIDDLEHSFNTIYQTEHGQLIHAECGGCSCGGSGSWSLVSSVAEAERLVPEHDRERPLGGSGEYWLTRPVP